MDLSCESILENMFGGKKKMRVSVLLAGGRTGLVGQAFQPAFAVDCHKTTEKVFFRPFHKSCRYGIVMNIIEFV
jgi:hypothetical protein